MDLVLVFPQELSGTTIWIWKKESDPDSTKVRSVPFFQVLQRAAGSCETRMSISYEVRTQIELVRTNFVRSRTSSSDEVLFHVVVRVRPTKFFFTSPSRSGHEVSGLFQGARTSRERTCLEQVAEMDPERVKNYHAGTNRGIPPPSTLQGLHPPP